MVKNDVVRVAVFFSPAPAGATLPGRSAGFFSCRLGLAGPGRFSGRGPFLDIVRRLLGLACGREYGTVILFQAF